MSVSALFQAGRVADTIDALAAGLRRDPTDIRQRTFLFELLCFAGEYDRADKHLELLADGGPQASLGAWLYRAALHAERERQTMFQAGLVPAPPAGAEPVPARVNGQAYHTLTDADPRIGARLEVYAAGQYTLIPFSQVKSLEIPAPKRLRDLLWAPATVHTGQEYRGLELGDVLIPVLAPLSWQHADDAVRLGRATEWQETDGGAACPVGQKLLLADEEEAIPFLEVRTIEFGVTDSD